MLLHKITLENFGAYKGRQSIDLTVKTGRPIILIGGLNGCGKTTLLDAIQLALYGARARCSGRGNRSYERYLRESINRQAEPKRARIELEFSITVEGQERRYEVIRSWQDTGKNAGEVLGVIINGKGDPVIAEGWADHVEDLLPLEVASLFFFDGEKIESLADPDRAAPVIASAVHSLLGVNTVEQLRTDLLGLQRRQKVAREDVEALEQITAIEKQLMETDQTCADATQRAASVQASLSRAQAILAEVESAFASEGGDLYHRRGVLEAEKKQVEDQLLNISETLANTIAAGPLPLRLLGPQLKSLKEQVAKEQAAAEAKQILGVLADRDKQLLQVIQELVSSEETLVAVEQHLEADRERRVNDTQTDRLIQMSVSAVQQLATLDQVLDHEGERAKSLITTASELRERMNALERQLAGVPDENLVASLIEERDQAIRHVAELTAELRVTEQARATTLRSREQLVAARERAYLKRAEGIGKAEHAARVVSYSERVRGTLEKFGDALLRRHIDRLEVAVLDSFTRLMRKTGLVRDLRIDTEKFFLTLIDSNGDKLDPSRLSAGERQLLAVSLLWGLARVAGDRLPSVIDTPLGRLDSRHRQHLVDRYFPHASRQVLLLSTDEEIDEYLLTRLEPAVARSYTLIHDDTSFTTTVEPGYWWNGGASHVA